MKHYIHEESDHQQQAPVQKEYDVVVVGGGMSGLCAAIASARQGAKTAIVQDRSVFGGNASSEMRMHISGASCHWGKRNAAETGILMELQLENKYLNDSYNYSIWDGVLWSAAQDCKTLDLYMNASMHAVDSDGAEIKQIECYQMTTETHYTLQAAVYLDATGNGTLGYLAGAEYKIGREDIKEYGEKDAPPVPDGETMGNTIYFVAEDVGHPVKFVKPRWAHTFTEEDFTYRYHGDITVYHSADDVVVLKPGDDYEQHADELVEKYDVKSGYWWIELGGNWDDIIKQAEDIRYELYQTVYGVWDHIKNGGDHGAENYELKWVGNLGGMRESRRLMGNYVLTETDILENRVFADGVAYGGWPMDEHTAAGYWAKGQIPSKVRSFQGLYSIPYGCYCSKTIRNLMMAGRNISASKLAMGSTRVMGTCAIGGEAAGIAAANAVKCKLTPAEYGKRHMPELRQELLKNDLYLIGCKNQDDADLARSASVTASSERAGFEARNVISGVTRNVDEQSHMWQSIPLGPDGEWVLLTLAQVFPIAQVRIVFDPDLSEERCISVSKAFMEKEPRGVAKTLVRDYTVEFLRGSAVIACRRVCANHQRLNVVDLEQPVNADAVRITVHSTNGCPDARVFEVRIYGSGDA